MKTEDEKYEEMLENRARTEHRDVLLAIRSIIQTKPGIDFFRYLFKSLDVTCVPEQGMKGDELFEYLGFLRAGNSIFKIMCEADASVAAEILSNIEKERYNDLTERYRIDTSYYTDTSS